MIWRGIAGFLACFTLANLLGETFFRGFDANIWWIDLRALPTALRFAVLLIGAIALLIFCLRPELIARLRVFWCSCVAGLALAALVNAIAFHALLARHQVRTNVPIPLSLLIAGALLMVTWKMLNAGDKAAPEQRAYWKAAAAFAACLVAFPLAQVFFFGHTDYRRPADAVVVFGARAYANGTPSGMLADRVATACELYRQGFVRTLIFSGGPGDGPVDEPHAMRQLALQLGVPDQAIILDPDGLNTEATARNTLAIFDQIGARRILAVSHGYHLPRIKMTYQRVGIDVLTVPARERTKIPSRSFAVSREVAALWVYYFRPARGGPVLPHSAIRVEVASS
ncbi:MAG TPA: YdcF family protein [Humisphaera sp.]|jgi:uncharacterized SAM-binding protein YcdF (DUF218 family)|nr:YdcF family protein [Humisphaera sp.]